MWGYGKLGVIHCAGTLSTWCDSLSQLGNARVPDSPTAHAVLIRVDGPMMRWEIRDIKEECQVNSVCLRSAFTHIHIAHDRKRWQSLFWVQFTLLRSHLGESRVDIFRVWSCWINNINFHCTNNLIYLSIVLLFVFLITTKEYKQTTIETNSINNINLHQQE